MKLWLNSNATGLFLVAIVTGMSTGCTALLNADFEGDDPGMLPDLTLPGPPDGDVIEWDDMDFSDAVELLALSVRSAGGGKALRYANINSVGPLTFKGAPASSGARWLVAVWVVQMEIERIPGARPAELNVHVFESGANPTLRLTSTLVGGSEQVLVEGNNTDGAGHPLVPLGSFSINDRKWIRMRVAVELATAKASLQISQSLRRDPFVSDRSVTVNQSLTLSTMSGELAPTITFQHKDERDGIDYFIDRIEIEGVRRPPA